MRQPPYLAAIDRMHGCGLEPHDLGCGPPRRGFEHALNHMTNIMAVSLVLQSVLLLVLLSAGDRCSCQDVFTAAQKLSRPTTNNLSAAKYLVSDLVPLVYAAAERVAQQVADGTAEPDIETCVGDLLKLNRTNQEVHLIGNKTLSVPAIALVLDAAGKPPAGLFQGAYAFRGNLEECQLINVSSINMRYCYLSMTIKISTTNQVAFPPLSEELCLPSSCDSAAINAFLEVLNDLIRSKSIPLHIDTNSTSFLSLSMEGQPLTTGAIIMIAVCSIILLLVAVGTIVEWVESKLPAKDENEFHAINSTKHLNGTEAENLTLLGERVIIVKRGKFCTFCYEAITAFSLYKNIPAILATKQPPAAINSLNGLRVQHVLGTRGVEQSYS